MRAEGDIAATAVVVTTWGEIVLQASRRGLCACRLPQRSRASGTPCRVLGYRIRGAREGSRVLRQAVRFLEKMLRGERAEPPPLDDSGATAFQRRIWRELRRIPRGRVMTYGEVARVIGKPGAARAVGAACRANPLPIFVPCHRVVARGGPGGYSAGAGWKEYLLGLERVRDGIRARGAVGEPR